MTIKPVCAINLNCVPLKNRNFLHVLMHEGLKKMNIGMMKTERKKKSRSYKYPSRKKKKIKQISYLYFSLFPAAWKNHSLIITFGSGLEESREVRKIGPRRMEGAKEGGIRTLA